MLLRVIPQNAVLTCNSAVSVQILFHKVPPHIDRVFVWFLYTLGDFFVNEILAGSFETV